MTHDPADVPIPDPDPDPDPDPKLLTASPPVFSSADSPTVALLISCLCLWRRSAAISAQYWMPGHRRRAGAKDHGMPRCLLCMPTLRSGLIHSHWSLISCAPAFHEPWQRHRDTAIQRPQAQAHTTATTAPRPRSSRSIRRHPPVLVSSPLLRDHAKPYQ